MGTTETPLEFSRLDSVFPVEAQLRVAFEDILRHHPYSPVTAGMLVILLAKRIIEGSCLAVVGTPLDNPHQIACLFVVEEGRDGWFGTRFANISIGWSCVRLSQRQRAHIAGLVERAAKQLEVRSIRWETKRNAAAMTRWASAAGYEPEGTVFERSL